MKLKFTSLFTLLVALGALPSAVLAASITWSTPVLETGIETDIITSGTFVDSASWRPDDQIVNGVTFNGRIGLSSGNLSFGNGSQITVTNIQNTISVGNAPWGTNYANLVSGGAYQYSTAAMNLGGLNVGQSYQVQVFEAFWNDYFPTSFGGSDPLDLGFGGHNPNYVVGTFTADAVTQAISLTSGREFGYGYVIFDAVQVRTASVPDSGTTAALLGTALLGLAALRRRFGCA
jgi:hypothetical protein